MSISNFIVHSAKPTLTRACAVVACIGLILLFSPLAHAQQSVAILTISRSSQSSVVHPGEQISFDVHVHAGIAIQTLAIVGENPFGSSDTRTNPPYRFSFTVPKEIRSGPFYFTAVARLQNGQVAHSGPAVVDVERETAPFNWTAEPQAIQLSAIGEEIPVSISANYSPSGPPIDLTRSALLQFSSSNESIASVSPERVVRAAGAGTSTVSATLKTASGFVRLEIPVTVAEPVLALSSYSFSFGSQPIGTESAPRNVTLTNSSSSPLDIREIRASGHFSATGNCLSLSPLAPEKTCSISVAFRPLDAGSQSGSLAIANGTIGAQTVISLTGWGSAK